MLFEAWDIWVDRVLHCKVTRVRIILRNLWFFLNENIRDHLNKSLGNKYTNHDNQNEFLEILAYHVLREKTEKIRENVFFFSIIGGGYTDISNKG